MAPVHPAVQRARFRRAAEAARRKRPDVAPAAREVFVNCAPAPASAPIVVASTAVAFLVLNLLARWLA